MKLFAIKNDLHLNKCTMYVCLCKAVTDDEIRDAVDAGVHTVSQLAETCGAGTGCGRCQQMAQEVIDEHLGESQYYAA